MSENHPDDFAASWAEADDAASAEQLAADAATAGDEPEPEGLPEPAPEPEDGEAAEEAAPTAEDEGADDEGKTDESGEDEVEKLRQELERERQRARSAEGRLKALKQPREGDEEDQPRQPAPQPHQPQPRRVPVPDELRNDFDKFRRLLPVGYEHVAALLETENDFRDQLVQMLEDDGATLTANYLVNRLQAEERQMERQQLAQQAQRQQQMTKAEQAHVARLAAIHEMHPETGQQEWVSGLNEWAKATSPLFLKVLTSGAPDEVNDVIQLYKQRALSAPAPANQRRQAQAAASESVTSRRPGAPPTKKPDKNDFEAAWNEPD